MHHEVIIAVQELFLVSPELHFQTMPDFLDTIQYIRMVFTLVPGSIGYCYVTLFHA